MRHARRPDSATTSGSRSDLIRLIETEQRLGQRMEGARREAAALHERATEEAHQAARALEDELAALRREQETRAGEALRLELEHLTGEAQAAAARYESLAEAAVERIARRVLQRLQRPLGPPP